MGNQKTLIIGFEKEPISYPHLKYVVEFFQKKHNADYYYFSERGYFLGIDTFTNIKYLLIFLFKIIFVFKDAIKLFYMKKNKYYKVIAVDNFSYVICSFIFKNTVLWSHDFVTDDQNHSKSLIQKKISSLTKKFLEKNKMIIIQDNDRLNLFLETYKIKEEIHSFYLPVSLPDVDYDNVSTPEKHKLTLMQIGGINKFRSGSHRLVDYYQNDFNNVNLILHGFFDEEIKAYLTENKKIPICSMLPLKASEVYKIVELSDIGFISYESMNLNFYFIANASGQLVEFLRLAKPIIVYGNTNLKEFVNQNNLGIGIERIEDLPLAIRTIQNNYNFYSKNCKNLFDQHFNLNIYLKNMYFWMFKYD